MRNKENQGGLVPNHPTYTDFSLLEKHAQKLCQQNDFVSAIQLVNAHRETFYSVAYILLGEIYFDKAKKAMPNPQGQDLKASLLNFTISNRYASESIDLIFEHRSGHNMKNVLQAMKTTCGVTVSTETAQELKRQADQWFEQHPYQDSMRLGM